MRQFLNTLMKIIVVLRTAVSAIMLGILALIFIASNPLFLDIVEKTYHSKDLSIEAKLRNVQRVANWAGGETNVLLSIRGSKFPDEYEVDNNGRIGEEDKYLLYVSKDKSWVRACLTITNRKGEPISMVCQAFLNLKTGKLIRFASAYSTPEQRKSGLFAPRKRSNISDKIDSEEIIWELMDPI